MAAWVNGMSTNSRVAKFAMLGLAVMVTGATVNEGVSKAGGVIVRTVPSITDVTTGARIAGSVTGGKTTTQGNLGFIWSDTASKQIGQRVQTHQHDALGVLNPHHQFARVMVWLGVGVSWASPPLPSRSQALMVDQNGCPVASVLSAARAGEKSVP